METVRVWKQLQRYGLAQMLLPVRPSYRYMFLSLIINRCWYLIISGVRVIHSSFRHGVETYEYVRTFDLLAY